MLTSIVILLYVCVILLDFIPKKKDLTQKGSIVYWTILTISFCVLALYSLDIKIPGPSEPIKYIIEKVFMPSG